VETAAQAEAVLAATDADEVWVCADTGHLLAAGDDPGAAMVTWAPRLAAVHLKDIDGDGRIVAAGQGRLPLAATLEAIATAIAAGAPVRHLTLEVEGMDDPESALVASAAAVTAVWRTTAAGSHADPGRPATGTATVHARSGGRA
jgi:sugar phosphate isomerase/epimerase